MVLHLAIKKNKTVVCHFHITVSIEGGRFLKRFLKIKQTILVTNLKLVTDSLILRCLKFSKFPSSHYEWFNISFFFFFLSHQNRPFTLLFYNYEHPYLYHTLFSKFLGTQNSTKSISKRKKETIAWIVKCFGSPAKSIK